MAAVVLQSLVVLQSVLLAIALTIMSIATRGYAGTEWGRVLQPITVAIAAFLLTTMCRQIPLSETTYAVASTSFWTVSTVAIVLATYRLDRMVRGRAQ